MAYRLEPGALIQPAGGIVGRDQQADAPATGHSPQPQHSVPQCQAAVAAALVAPVHGKPAQPPAGGVPQFGVDHVETDQPVARGYRKHRMSRASRHGGKDGLNRAEKAGNLLRVQFDCGHCGELVAAYSMVARGHDAPC